MEDEDKKQPIQYKKIWKMVWPFVKKTGHLSIFLILLNICGAIIWIAQPYYFGKIIDGLIASLQARVSWFSAVRYYVFLFIALAGAATLVSGLAGYFRWYLMNKVYPIFTDAVYRKMLTLDIAKYQNEQGGTLLKKISNAANGFMDLLSAVHYAVIGNGLQFIGAAVVGMFIDWRLTLVALAPTPVLILITLWVVRSIMPDHDKAQKLWEKGDGFIGDTFMNIAPVKNFSLEKWSALKAFRFNQKAAHTQNQVNIRWGITSGLYGFLMLASRAAVFIVGSYFVINGSATIGSLIMFLGFSNLIFGAVDAILNMLPEMAKWLSRIGRAVDIWEEVPRVHDLVSAQSIRTLNGDIQFQNIHFSYNENQAVLHDVNLLIPQGQTLALVGQSGAGKSTIAQLLVRFYDPTSGVISIGGKDIKTITLDSLRKNVGFVMQENLLFHDTIYNNIALAKPGAKSKEVEAAAKRAQAHEFIVHLPEKYDSVVGERGVKLSGGEKQRIALARVLLADPPILVLDEATSALDSKTEHDLQKALREVMKNRTTLVIAHRLSTVMHADNILVLDHGRVVDQGKHNELIARGGLYKEYWEIQAGGYVG